VFPFEVNYGSSLHFSAIPAWAIHDSSIFQASSVAFFQPLSFSAVYCSVSCAEPLSPYSG